MEKDPLNVTMAQLIAAVATATGLPVTGPFYLYLGDRTKKVARSQPFASSDGPDFVVDFDENGEALGIEFLTFGGR